MVSFDIESLETMRINEELSKILRDIYPIRYISHVKRNDRPRFMVQAKLTPEEAEQTLEKSLHHYTARIKSVPAIGLCLHQEMPHRDQRDTVRNLGPRK